MNFMAKRSDLLKSYRQKNAPPDQLHKAPDPYRRRRGRTSLAGVYLLLHFFAAIRDKPLIFQHRFWLTEPQLRAAASLLSPGPYRNVIRIR